MPLTQKSKIKPAQTDERTEGIFLADEEGTPTRVLPTARFGINRPDCNMPGGRKPAKGVDPDKPGGRY